MVKNKTRRYSVNTGILILVAIASFAQNSQGVSRIKSSSRVVTTPTVKKHKRVLSVSSRAARQNIYPKASYTNRSANRKRKSERSFKNGAPIGQPLRYSTRSNSSPVPTKRRIGARSLSRPFIVPGRKNVYWGKFSKGEKPFTKDISGRRLRKKNFKSKSPSMVKQTGYALNRKRSQDKPYQGTFQSGYVTSLKTKQRAWRGNISGHSLRKSNNRDNQLTGQRVNSRSKLSVSGKQVKNNPLPKGGGSVNRSGWNNQGRSIQSRQPQRASAWGVGSYSGNLKRGRGSLSKGGGSVSRGGWNNQGRSIQSRQPQRASAWGVGSYSGNLKRGRGSLSKGGGSVSRGGWNNQGRSIQSRQPQRASAWGVGSYSGNLKRGRGSLSKGGGSVSRGGWNNQGRSIQSRQPQRASAWGVGSYSGNLKRGRGSLSKGGGSVSRGGWNNQGRSIQSRQPQRASAWGVGSYSGNLKRGRGSLSKGGGSVSRGGWNNQGRSIQSRQPQRASAWGVGSYSGNLKQGSLSKGGGSVGRGGWNNQGKPIQSAPPNAGYFSSGYLVGRTKRNYDYIQNPRANKNALKKREPADIIFAVSNLQVAVKRQVLKKKPHANSLAFKGKAPQAATVKASEYEGYMKRYWTHRHNPKSDKFALDVRWPGRAYARINNYQGNIKMNKRHGKEFHPDTQFASRNLRNIKSERSIFTNLKLWWAKSFKKNDTQPKAVKEKIRKPRYDRKEKELWKDLYD